MTSYPPIPPAYAPAPLGPVKAPRWLWLIPLAALLAVIGAATPWFKARGSYDGVSLTFGSLYSWRDGKIGLIAPILLVILAAGTVPLLQNKTSGRFARGTTHPLISAGRTAIGFGGVTIAGLVVAWILVPHQYKFDLGTGSDVSWSYLTSHGISMSRGPQIGFWLTGAAGGLAIVTGVLLLVTTTAQPVAAPPLYPPPPPYLPPRSN